MGGDDTDLQQYILWANPKMSDDYEKRSSIWVNRNVWHELFSLSGIVKPKIILRNQRLSTQNGNHFIYLKKISIVKATIMVKAS